MNKRNILLILLISFNIAADQYSKTIVREKVKAIICLGIDNTKLLETFKPISEIIVETESIDEAVKIASKIAEKKDNVLLSPACASFDLFESYEDRGNQFKQAVRNL